jgi:hypothetical protein
MLGWIYTLFFIFLGCSAAIWGGWLEHAGPAQGRRCIGIVLVRRSADFGAGYLYSPDLADVDRLRASLAVSVWVWVISRRSRP